VVHENRGPAQHEERECRLRPLVRKLQRRERIGVLAAPLAAWALFAGFYALVHRPDCEAGWLARAQWLIYLAAFALALLGGGIILHEVGHGHVGVILAASVVLLVIPWFGPVLFAPVPLIGLVVAARAERRYAGAALDYCIVLAFLWITPWPLLASLFRCGIFYP
jgi:hypothetical protein